MANHAKSCERSIHNYKPTDKGSSVAVWDREDCLAEGYKQLSDTSTHAEVKGYNYRLLSQFTEKSSKCFK